MAISSTRTFTDVKPLFLMTRPGLTGMVAFSALVSYLMATGTREWSVALALWCGIYLLSAAASILNQIQERKIDARMARTRLRPLASGTLSVTDALLLVVGGGQLWAFDYPAAPPGKAACSLDGQRAILANGSLRGQWALDAGRITALALTNKHTNQTLRLKTGHLPRIVLDDGRIVELAALTPFRPVQLENNALDAVFKDQASGLEFRWSAALSDTANYIIGRIMVYDLYAIAVFVSYVAFVGAWHLWEKLTGRMEPSDATSAEP